MENDEDILQYAFILFEQGDLKSALEEVSKLLNHDEVTAHSVMGQFNFQSQIYDEAEKHFLKAVTLNPSSVGYFNVATASTMNKNFDKGKEAFEMAIKLKQKEQGNEFGVQTLVFYYQQCLQEVRQFDRSLEQLNIFRDFYSRSKITDLTHVILASGGDASIPPFEVVLERAIPTLKHIGEKEAKKWLDQLSRNIDDDGKKVVASFKLKLGFKS